MFPFKSGELQDIQEGTREKGEWVRVERRNHRSERQPVRQIYPRRGDTKSGDAHRLGRFEEHDKSKVVRRIEGKLIKSFLVRNFPPDCSTGELISKCLEAGPVVDLYCPQKLDLKGKRFCFVRMQMDSEEQEKVLLAELNSLWINSYKLRAFIPQFGRREGEKTALSREIKEREQRKKANSEEPPRPQPAIVVGNGRTFAQVTRECRCPCTDMQHRLPWKTTFIPDENESAWLVNAKVGKLKPDFAWEDYKEDLKEEMKGCFEVSHLGENLILFRTLQEKVGQQEKEEEWANFWLSWVRPWKPSDVSHRREVWTTWFGVPLHAWTERFFKQVSSRFGVFLDWDSNTKRRLTLDKARIKIWGYSLKSINEIVSIRIDQSDFSVLIVEDQPREIEEESEGNFSVTDSDECVGETQGLDDEPQPENASVFENFCSGPNEDIGRTKVMINKGDTGAQGKGVGLRKEETFHEAECGERAVHGLSVSHDFNATCSMNENLNNLTESGPRLLLRSPMEKPDIKKGVESDENPTFLEKEPNRQAQNACDKTQPPSLDSTPFPPGWGPLPLFQKDQVRDEPTLQNLGDQCTESTANFPNSSKNSKQTQREGASTIQRNGKSKAQAGRSGRRTLNQRMKIPKKVRKKMELKTAEEFFSGMHSPIHPKPSSLPIKTRAKSIKVVRRGNSSEAEAIYNMGSDLGLQPIAPMEEVVGVIRQMVEGNDSGKNEARLSQIVNVNEAS